MDPKPNRREKQLAEAWAPRAPDAEETAALLALYREELLKPIDELRRDLAAYHDHRVVRWLEDTVRMLRGEP